MINTYNIVIEKRAQKFIRKQNRDVQQKILKAISKLPNFGDIKKLEGYKEKIYRLRVNDIRIIYTVDHSELIVTIIDADSRGQVYK